MTCYAWLTIPVLMISNVPDSEAICGVLGTPSVLNCTPSTKIL